MVNEFIAKNGLITPAVDGGAVSADSLNVNGLTYPTVDGSPGDVIETDGTGNLTFQAPSGGGGGGTQELLRLNFDSGNFLVSIDQTTSGISGTNIVGTLAEDGKFDVSFTGHSYPPLSMMSYGYNAPAQIYKPHQVDDLITGAGMTLAAGGTIEVPTAFGAFTGPILIPITLTSSGAVKNAFPVVGAHIWIVFYFGD